MKHSILAILLLFGLAPDPAMAKTDKPNILVIFADDVGYWNLSHINHGMDGLQDAQHRPPRG